MTRPEWRVPFQSNISGSSSTSTSRVDLAARSYTSLETTGSDFLAESIHHNIRNTFNQNLLSQVGYSIDRMSVRHTPASLVSFCGKTCAYAFFFCPDVANVLVKLWNISPTLLRNVINEFDPGHDHVLRGVMAEEISSQFPPAVRNLAFSGHSSFLRALRRNTSVPLAAAQINWFGPWAPRWAGRGYRPFFRLLETFLPPNHRPVPINYRYVEKDIRSRIYSSARANANSPAKYSQQAYRATAYGCPS